jgi:hypothetical protein
VDVEPARKQQQPRLLDIERRAALRERAELAVDGSPVLAIRAVAPLTLDANLGCAHVDARTVEHGPLLVSELHLYHDIFDVTVCARNPRTHPRRRFRPRASLLRSTRRTTHLTRDLTPISDEELARRRIPRQAQSARPRGNRPPPPSLLSGSRTLRGDRSNIEAPGPYVARRRCSRSPGRSWDARHATAPGTATPPPSRRVRGGLVGLVLAAPNARAPGASTVCGDASHDCRSRRARRPRRRRILRSPLS